MLKKNQTQVVQVTLLYSNLENRICKFSCSFFFFFTLIQTNTQIPSDAKRQIIFHFFMNTCNHKTSKKIVVVFLYHDGPSTVIPLKHNNGKHLTLVC